MNALVFFACLHVFWLSAIGSPASAATSHGPTSKEIRIGPSETAIKNTVIGTELQAPQILADEPAVQSPPESVSELPAEPEPLPATAIIPLATPIPTPQLANDPQATRSETSVLYRRLPDATRSYLRGLEERKKLLSSSPSKSLSEETLSALCGKVLEPEDESSAPMMPVLMANTQDHRSIIGLRSLVEWLSPNDSGERFLRSLRHKTILDVGAGKHPELALFFLNHLGFKTEQVHTLDPLMLSPYTKQDRFVQAKIEDAPDSWTGRFDLILSFYTFNREIVAGGLPDMGDGIDMPSAAQSLERILKPEGWLIIVAASMAEEDAYTLAEHFEAKGLDLWRSGIYLFRKLLAS